MRYHAAPYLIWSLALLAGLALSSIASGQALDFKVDGPTTIAEGEYVELSVRYPAGIKADVTFVPVEEESFGVHPIVSESLVDGKLSAEIVGKTCAFSARCAGEREIVVVATSFALIDGVPRLNSIKHRIAVTAKHGPAPPPKDEPKQPPNDPGDDDLGPIVPLPGASLPKSDVDKITLILSNVVDRIEALEQRSQVSVAAPTPGVGQSAAPPASSAVEATVQSVPSPVVKPVIVDAKPGHWTVGPARNPGNPTKAETIAHLRNDHPSKAAQHEPLEALTHEELRTLHDDSHEGRASVTQTVSPVSVYTQPVVMRSGSGCPGGVCPTPSRSTVRRGLFGWGR